MERDRDFAKLQMLINGARTEHDKVVSERDRVASAYKELSLHHSALSSELKDFQDQVISLSEALEVKTKDIENIKVSTSARVSHLEALGVEKDTLLKSTQEDLEKSKTSLDTVRKQLAESEAVVLSLREELSGSGKHLEASELEKQSLKEDLSHQVGLAEKRQADIEWLLRHGVSGVVQAFLNSTEFVARNSALQEECVRFGKYQGCLDTQAFHQPLLDNVGLVHHFPDAKANVISLFSELLSPTYSLLQTLETGSVSVDDLKQMMENPAVAPEDVAESSHPEQDPPAT